MPGNNREAKNPLSYTEDYRDGLGNKLTMHAYANIEGENMLSDRFGIIRFNKSEKSITFESWYRFSDVTKAGVKQMTG